MIETKNLVYVFPDSTVGLHPMTFSLPSSSRSLLIGANGAGKSTLLKILAGKTLAKNGAVFINDKDPFRDGVQGITYLGTEWAGNPMVRRDIPVSLLLASIGGDLFPERRDELVDILDIDLKWHMHAVSDGERRRVQLAMGLLRPWEVLLLDEVTVDLDVLVRARLLEFLKIETEQRSCQIVYATHIFDGLSDWPSHIVHMHLGQILSVNTYEEICPIEAEAAVIDGKHKNSSLLELALGWLRKDLEERGRRKEKRKWADVEKELLENDVLTSANANSTSTTASQGLDNYFGALRGHV